LEACQYARIFDFYTNGYTDLTSYRPQPFSTEKKALIKETMQFTEKENQAFWPCIDMISAIE
jgi:hypothetical protein